MKLSLERKQCDGTSTIGKLFVDGFFQCYTLELPIDEGEQGFAIPEGTYEVTIRHSADFGRQMPHLENVPGRSEIMLHWGNSPKDTKGCVLTGQQAGPMDDWISHSKLAFDALFPKILAALEKSPVFIEVTNPGTAPDVDGEISV